jgi:YggT family protein
MFVARELLLAVAWLLEWVLQAYVWIIIIRALVSWVNADPWNPLVRFLHAATEPVLRPVRRRLPATGIDFSPVVVILAIWFLERLAVGILREAAYRVG